MASGLRWGSAYTGTPWNPFGGPWDHSGKLTLHLTGSSPIKQSKKNLPLNRMREEDERRQWEKRAAAGRPPWGTHGCLLAVGSAGVGGGSEVGSQRWVGCPELWEGLIGEGGAGLGLLDRAWGPVPRACGIRTEVSSSPTASHHRAAQWRGGSLLPRWLWAPSGCRSQEQPACGRTCCVSYDLLPWAGSSLP